MNAITVYSDKLDKAWNILINKNYLFIYFKDKINITLTDDEQNINNIYIPDSYLKIISAKRLSLIIQNHILNICHNLYSK